MAKIKILEVKSRREWDAPGELRCARAPKDLDADHGSVNVIRDDGAVVHVTSEDKRWKLDTLDLSDTKTGDKVLARHGTAPPNGNEWLLFEVK